FQPDPMLIDPPKPAMGSDMPLLNPPAGSVTPSNMPLMGPPSEVPRYGKPIGPENPSWGASAPLAAPKGSWRTRVDIPVDGRTASVRYGNPGAQYPSPHAERFGLQGYGIIGGGHKIGLFPS